MLKHAAAWPTSLAILVFVSCASTLFAQSIPVYPSTGDSSTPIYPVYTISGVPPTNYSAGAYATSLTYGSDGLMYVWDGQNVYQQTAVNGQNFAIVGTMPVPNSADAGPITFSSDGSALLISNGGGGSPPPANTGFPQSPTYAPPPGSSLPQPTSYNGSLFTLPAPSASNMANPPVQNAVYAGTVMNNFSAIPVPKGALIPDASTSYFVDAANSSGGSQVAIFDAKTGTVTPIITGIPGASTGLTLDSAGNLYVGIAYAPPFPAPPTGDTTGSIETFKLTDLVKAYNTTTPVTWADNHSTSFYSPDGSNDTDSGNGMFVDAQGYFFTGGPDGLTMISPTGLVTQYSDPGLFESFPSVTYNPLENQFALTPFGGDPEIFNISEFHAVPVPEPTSVVALISAGLMGVIIVRWRRRCGK